MSIAVRTAQATWEGDVTARVPGLDPASFDAMIGEASELCPASRLFAGAKVTVGAALEPAP